ncbi:hypothetical protein [Bacillus kwashiorkori]|uniref:hypothetical protein n=1 Tax=Bacillus kwashiorkori TaxID=1522318 RepID=UPI00078474BB|nr:hypothetical protein [Bacillus kwashiorkori]
MIGLLINKKENEELIYVLKRELDELLFDFNDERISDTVKKSMDERYDILFSLFKRIAPPKECLMYMRKKQGETKRGKIKSKNNG